MELYVEHSRYRHIRDVLSNFYQVFLQAILTRQTDKLYSTLELYAIFYLLNLPKFQNLSSFQIFSCLTLNKMISMRKGFLKENRNI